MVQTSNIYFCLFYGRCKQVYKVIWECTCDKKKKKTKKLEWTFRELMETILAHKFPKLRNTKLP